MSRMIKRFFERHDWFAGRLFDLLTWKCAYESVAFFCIYSLLIYCLYKLGNSFITNIGVIFAIFAIGDMSLPYCREIFERDSDVKSSIYFFECFRQLGVITGRINHYILFWAILIIFHALGATDFFPGKPHYSAKAAASRT